MSQTSITFDAVLKDHYEEILAEQINSKCRLRSLVENRGNKDATDGRQVIFPAVTQRSWAAGSPGNSDLPTASNVASAKFTVPYKRLVGRIQVERFVMEQARTDMGTFAKAMAVELEGMMNTMKVIHNRQLHGDGTGKIAEVLSLSGQDITMRSAYNTGTGFNSLTGAGARHIRVGMVLAVMQGATSTLRQGSLTVSAVNYTTNVVTVTGTTTGIVASDSVFQQIKSASSYAQNNEFMGLSGIIDDGTFVGTFQNLSRTTYPILNASVIGNSGTQRNVTLGLLQDGLDLCDQASGQNGIKFWWCHHSIRNQIATLLQANQRYTALKDMGRGIKESVEESDYSTTVTYNDIPVVVDRDAAYYTLYGIDPTSLRLWELAPLKWAEIDGRRWHLVDGSDEQQAWAVLFGNFGCTHPNKNVVIKDLSGTPLVGFTPS